MANLKHLLEVWHPKLLRNFSLQSVKAHATKDTVCSPEESGPVFRARVVNVNEELHMTDRNSSSL